MLFVGLVLVKKNNFIKLQLFLNMDRERLNPLMSPCMIDKQWLIKSKIGNIEDDYEFDAKKDVSILIIHFIYLYRIRLFYKHSSKLINAFK